MSLDDQHRLLANILLSSAVAGDDDNLRQSEATISSLTAALARFANLRFLLQPQTPALPTYWSDGPKANCLLLPREVLAKILLELGAVEIIESAQKVCRQWRSVCMEPSMWTHIDMHNQDYICTSPDDLAKMCRHAIDLSRGGCVDINIYKFCDDDLLQYIVERCCKLSHLRLGKCLSVSDDGLAKAARRLPLLETFEFRWADLTRNALEAIGKNCPRLTTLIYNQLEGRRHWPYSELDDDGALAIANYMPGLRHLSLFGNMLTNKGLGAILEGCPHLESLDLRECINVDLKDSLLAKKCERIKGLKCPSDPSGYYLL